MIEIGILNVCTPAEEQEFNSSEFKNFEIFFDHVDHPFTFKEYRVTEGDFPPTVDTHSTYLITGSPTGVYDDKRWLIGLNQFIQQAYAADKKLVGICFGHQMLAHSLGGEARKSDKGWGVGLKSVDVINHQPWMDHSIDQLNLYYCHQDQVEALPANAVHLGGNAFCPNAMFSIGTQVLGIQGHPEFTRKTMDFAINYLNPVLPSSVTESAKETIDGARDSQIVAQWIVDFVSLEEPST